MAYKKQTIFTVMLGASILSLGACGFSHPNAMPTGYTYHHQTYQSPAPKSIAKKVMVERPQYMNSTQAEQFRGGIYSLVESLTMRAGMPPKPVYVLSPEPMTSFYTNLDNNLRQSMRHIGYNLSDSPHDAYVFTYDAMPISPISDMANNVQLTLRVFTGVGENAKQLTEETGQFFVQGAEKLSITPARYMGLPTMMATPPQPQQMVAPAAVEAIPAPMAMTPSIPAPEVTTTMQRQRVSDPVVMTPARAPVVRAPLPDVPMPKIQSNASQQSPAIIAPSLSVPAVAIPKAEVDVPQAALDFESPQYTVQLEQEVVEPSRDDIVIINRDVETPDFDEGMALSGAQSVPQSTKDLVRGRVSNPADY